jgi:hypothetical protein
MSRLDSAIRRLLAQRACLDRAVELIADAPGPVLEFGLGNGRTFDHLRSLLPERDIYVFERKVAAHPDCVPDDTHLFVGAFGDTAPTALDRTGARAVLAHCDIGSGDAAASQKNARALVPLLVPLVAPGAIVVGDQNMGFAGWQDVALPDGVAPGRYFIYRVG